MIAGLVPLSASDFPGCLSAVLFCRGCPWRCGYCQNAHLVDSRISASLSWHEVTEFLGRRVGLLDGVVFSGGEPTLQRSLPSAIETVRAIGFRIGLHTSGAYPKTLEKVLPLVDWVGMDVKAPFEDYESITNAPGSGKCAKTSAMLVLESGVDYEFRTTLHPKKLDSGKILALAETLSEMGALHYKVQEFRPMGCLDETLLEEDATHVTEEISAQLGSLF